MIKIYVYPNARKPFEHDTLDFNYNTTVFSEKGIKDHCTLVSPEEAELFYMGQISCGTYTEFSESDFKYLKNNYTKHVVEIEGDWYQKRIPSWLLDCNCVGNGNRTYYYPRLFFTRPCLSRLLVYLAKNNIEYDIDLPEQISFGFIGQHDPYHTRIKTYNILKSNNINHEIYFNEKWSAQVDLKKDNQIIQNFAGVLKRNILSLCPRGVGEDSSRFYETCFFGRVPVIIGHCKIMDEDKLEDKFFYRINPDLPDDKLLEELNKIYSTPLEELKKKCYQAKEYFNNNVKKYFEDPTKYYLTFLNFNEKNS